MFDRVRFVLVQPTHPGNIGAAARALRVMGFTRLALVAPGPADARNDPEARARAVGGVGVLAAAPVYATLAAALSGVRCAFAMSGYAREFGPPLRPLRAACAVLPAELAAADGDVAFVFGGERNGLANEDVERCTACVAIPADPHYGSLNLAQAVQVAAYEARLALLGAAGGVAAAPMPAAQGVDKLRVDEPGADKRGADERGADQPGAGALEADDPAAGLDAVDAMVEHLREALVAVGYLDPAAPRRLPARLRRLFVRARPTSSEVDILRGIAAAIIRRKSERAGARAATATATAGAPSAAPIITAGGHRP